MRNRCERVSNPLILNGEAKSNGFQAQKQKIGRSKKRDDFLSRLNIAMRHLVSKTWSMVKYKKKNESPAIDARDRMVDERG